MIVLRLLCLLISTISCAFILIHPYEKNYVDIISKKNNTTLDISASIRSSSSNSSSISKSSLAPGGEKRSTIHGFVLSSNFLRLVSSPKEQEREREFYLKQLLQQQRRRIEDDTKELPDKGGTNCAVFVDDIFLDLFDSSTPILTPCFEEGDGINSDVNAMTIKFYIALHEPLIFEIEYLEAAITEVVRRFLDETFEGGIWEVTPTNTEMEKASTMSPLSDLYSWWQVTIHFDIFVRQGTELLPEEDYVTLDRITNETKDIIETAASTGIFLNAISNYLGNEVWGIAMAGQEPQPPMATMTISYAPPDGEDAVDTSFATPTLTTIAMDGPEGAPQAEAMLEPAEALAFDFDEAEMDAPASGTVAGHPGVEKANSDGGASSDYNATAVTMAPDNYQIPLWGTRQLVGLILLLATSSSSLTMFFLARKRKELQKEQRWCRIRLSEDGLKDFLRYVCKIEKGGTMVIEDYGPKGLGYDDDSVLHGDIDHQGKFYKTCITSETLYDSAMQMQEQQQQQQKQQQQQLQQQLQQLQLQKQLQLQLQLQHNNMHDSTGVHLTLDAAAYMRYENTCLNIAGCGVLPPNHAFTTNNIEQEMQSNQRKTEMHEKSALSEETPATDTDPTGNISSESQSTPPTPYLKSDSVTSATVDEVINEYKSSTRAYEKNRNDCDHASPNDEDDDCDTASHPSSKMVKKAIIWR